MKTDYFKRKLTIVLRDIEQYTAAELFRELSRMSLTAADQADMNVEVKILNEHRHK